MESDQPESGSARLGTHLWYRFLIRSAACLLLLNQVCGADADGLVGRGSGSGSQEGKEPVVVVILKLIFFLVCANDFWKRRHGVSFIVLHSCRQCPAFSLDVLSYLAIGRSFCFNLCL